MPKQTVRRPKRVRRRTTGRVRRFATEQPLSAGGLRSRGGRLSLPPLAWPQVIALVWVFALLGLLSFLSWRSDFYVYAENVRVEGLQYTTREAVYQAALIEGYHVFFLDPQVIARRVEALPYVREATVRVGLPASVVIRVSERQPVVRWFWGREEYWVDEEGVILPPLNISPPPMALMDPEGLAVWQGAEGPRRLNPRLIAVLLTVRDAFPQIQRAYYERATGLRLLLPFRGRDVQIIWGDVLIVNERLQRLQEVWSQMQRSGEGYTLIDVTTPDQVIVRR